MKKIILMLAISIAIISLSKAAYYQAYAEASASYNGSLDNPSFYGDIDSRTYYINEWQNATVFAGAWTNDPVAERSIATARGIAYDNNNNQVGKAQVYQANDPEVSVSTGYVYIQRVEFYVDAYAPVNTSGIKAWSRASLSW